MAEQDAVQTVILMDVFNGESAQSQDTVSTRKRARPDSSHAAMKRQRKEQTNAQDVSRGGTSVHSTRQKLKPLLPTFPGGLMQARYLESPGMKTAVGETAMGEGPKESKKEAKRMASMCAHKRRRRTCKECGGLGICEHQRQRSVCKECGGSSICEHQRVRRQCKECKGSSICEHQRVRSQCKECKGSSICQHQRQRSQCRDCGGSSICEHQRIRNVCKECKGSSICEHQRRRSQCKECKGSSICEHQRQRSRCKDCKGSSI